MVHLWNIDVQLFSPHIPGGSTSLRQHTIKNTTPPRTETWLQTSLALSLVFPEEVAGGGGGSVARKCQGYIESASLCGVFQAHFSGEHRTGKVFSPCISLFVTTSTYGRTTMMKTSFTQKSGIRQVHSCARADTSTAGLRGETKSKVSDLDRMGLGDDFDSALCDVLAQLPYLIGSSAVCWRSQSRS